MVTTQPGVSGHYVAHIGTNYTLIHVAEELTWWGIIG